MRLLTRMESSKTRGLNVFVMLLLALSLAACNEDKDDFHQYESSNLKERSIPKAKKIFADHYHYRKFYRPSPSRPERKYFVSKKDISDTLNYSPEEKAKNYQNSFKIWSGVYRLKSQKTASDTSSLKLDENYEIPFVGKTLKIGDKEYSTLEMVELVQKEKTALLNVIASKIKWNGLYFRMDLNELRKGIDSLQTIKEMFSEIDLKVRRDSKSFFTV